MSHEQKSRLRTACATPPYHRPLLQTLTTDPYYIPLLHPYYTLTTPLDLAREHRLLLE